MDKELLDALRNQNPFAQKRVYDQYVRRMFRVCRRYLMSDEDAQDALMTGFVKFFRHADRIDVSDGQTLEPYLRKVMVNECLQWLRKQRMTYVAIDHLPESEEPFEPPGESWQAEELYQLILSLPDGYRTIFNLYALEGYSHQEIAEKLNISESTSKTQLYKARLWLQKKLSGTDYGRTYR